MTDLIRFATAADAERIASIYRPFVDDSAVSFESEPPSADEMAFRIARIAELQLPWLVMTRDGSLVGYAYASRHRDRTGYQWSVETSVYVDSAAIGTGVGRKLYSTLFAILKDQGYQNVYAGTTLPNDSSIGLHRALGFREVAVYEKVGYKFSKWHDVAWWELSIGSHPTNLEPPGKLPAVVPTV